MKPENTTASLTVPKTCARCNQNFDSVADNNFCEDCIADDRAEDQENDSPDYWECLGCGYSCLKRPTWGGQCPKCMTHMEEGYY